MKKKPKMSKRQAIIAKVKKEGEAKVSAAARAKNNRIGGRSVFRDPLPPKMAMRKKK